MASLRSTANEAARSARDAWRETSRAATSASGDLQTDLQNLRDDFARLAQQVGDILSAKGTAAWQRTRSSLDSAMSDARSRGREAASTVGDVSDSLLEAIEDSVKERPYATLAVVAGIGFLFGLIWRR